MHLQSEEEKVFSISSLYHCTRLTSEILTRLYVHSLVLSLELYEYTTIYSTAYYRFAKHEHPKKKKQLTFAIRNPIKYLPDFVRMSNRDANRVRRLEAVQPEDFLHFTQHELLHHLPLGLNLERGGCILLIM